MAPALVSRGDEHAIRIRENTDVAGPKRCVHRRVLQPESNGGNRRLVQQNHKGAKGSFHTPNTSKRKKKREEIQKMAVQLSG